MTNTDTTETDIQHTGTPGPSSNYDGCLNLAAIDQRYKDLMGVLLAANPSPAERKRLTAELQEDHRRAHVRLVGPAARQRRSTGAARAAAAPVVLKPAEADDGSLVITCEGPCGETKSFKKFPTLGGGRPGRSAVCRSCRDDAIAARKNKA